MVNLWEADLGLGATGVQAPVHHGRRFQWRKWCRRRPELCVGWGAESGCPGPGQGLHVGARGLPSRVPFGSGAFRRRPGPERRGEPRNSSWSRHWRRGEVGAREAIKGERLSVHRSFEDDLRKRTDKETLCWLNFSVNKSHLRQRAVLQL